MTASSVLLMQFNADHDHCLCTAPSSPSRSDTAGQVHFYSTGAPSEAMTRLPHDQFFSQDYTTLARDING